MMAEKSKPAAMAKELKGYGDERWGFIVRSGAVVLIGPGAAFEGKPEPTYSAADLREAEKEGLLEKTNWTVGNHTGKTWTFDVYILKKISAP